MSKKLKASIIIPSFNTRELLLKNLPKVIEAYKNSRNQIIEIILVDDASPDDSVKVVKTYFPEIKVIAHKKNRGFSSSVNTGARHSKGELLVLLNTDVVPSSDFLVSTQKLFEDKSLFAVSLHEKGYGPGIAKYRNGFIEQSPGDEVSKLSKTFWISGGSGVFRRDVWMKLGGMDEELLSPFYWEDFDLSFRALKRGYKLLWDPNGMVVHKHESTMSKLSPKYIQRIRERNYLLIHWRNITSRRMMRRHIVAVLLRAFRNPGYFRIILMALGRIKIAYKKRKREKKEGKVSDEAIFAGLK